MATSLKIDVFDIETKTSSKINLTDDEIADREIQHAENLAAQAAQEAKVAARQSALAKLAELGLTKEEIAAL